MSETWPGMTGNWHLVRIGIRAADEGTCPEQQAAKALPAVWPGQRSYVRKQFLNDFPLGAVMNALDDVEFRGLSREQVIERLGREAKPPMHPGAIRWARHAAVEYLDAGACIDTPATTPVPHYWVAQQARGEVLWELYAWGRRYASPDGTVREFRFIRFGEANMDKWDKGDAGKRGRARVAIAAYGAAFGIPAPKPHPWGEAFRPLRGEHPVVQRIRVLEVGLDGGKPAVLFDGTPAQAEKLYAEHARDQVRTIKVGGEAQPGTECAGCKLNTACDTLPRIPGLLGVADPTGPQRTWSVSNGRSYQVCPAQDHLLRLHIPKQNEYSESAVRGHAVHAWLEENHRNPIHAACTVWDIPLQPDDWTAGKWHITGEEALAGSRMLANHADLCPYMRGDQITEVRLEPTLAFHDTDANVIVVAKPDMLYKEDGAWVYRETKTRQRPLRPGTDLFHDFPQLALATVLMAENALGGKPAGTRIELELLTSDAADVLLIDPSDPAEVAKARTAVHDLAASWHSDKAAAARPGKHCQSCPVSRWCPDVQVGETA